MTPQDISTLIAKYLAGEANLHEEHELRHWVDMDEENEQQFERAYAAWEEIEQSPQVYRPNVDAAWELVETKLKEGAQTASGSAKISVAKKWKWILGLILLLITILLSIWWIQSDGHNLERRYETNGSRQMVYLPDSTRIELYPQSQLILNKQQQIELAGGADIVISELGTKELKLLVGPIQVLDIEGHCQIQESRPRKVIEIKVEKGSLTVTSAKEKVVFRTGEKGVYQVEDGLIRKDCE